jgi:transposase
VSIEVEIYERIRHLHEHEGMSQRAIAKALGISRNTVKKYFDGSQVPWERQGVSGRKPYVITEEVVAFIKECLAQDETEKIKKQRHTAKRIYDRLVEEKGFAGGESTIREIVAQLRETKTDAFIPLVYDPGEAVQIDWGEAKIYLCGKKITVNIFCMRECYSADIYCVAFYRQNEESFLEAQISGFEYFGGVAKRVIFDNAKVAVKEGFGAHAKVQDKYKALSAHYAFQCEFCNVAAGHEKGLVEGLVGWVRRNIFVPIPRVNTIQELNNELMSRCLKYRKHNIKGKPSTVGEMAVVAKVHMTPLPRYKFDTSKTITARADSFSTVRFDRNNYSIPCQYASKEVSIKGFGNEVAMYYRNTEIARYTRCYDRNKTMYHLEHYIDLIEKRPRSVFNAKPVKDSISVELIEIGRRLSSPHEMVKLLRLLVDYGEEKLITAIRQVQGHEISVDQIKAYLIPDFTPAKIQPGIEIKVARPQFDKYDSLMKGDVVV